MILKKFFFEYSEIHKVYSKSVLKNSAYKFCTHTKLADTETAFVAIKGEKFDAFKFIPQIIGRASLIIFESSEDKLLKAEKLSEEFPEVCLIAVDNCEKYIQNLAKLHSEHCQSFDGFKMVAISGSNGKTTTKDILYHLLDSVHPGKVIATLKNDNNHLGVPFTVLRIDPNIIKTAIIEYGSNHPGELEFLCQLTHPNLGMTTNVGDTHMEFFPTLEDVFIEESRTYHRVRSVNFDKGLFLINEDDEFLNKLERFKNSKTFSLKNSSSDYFLEILGQSVLVDNVQLENVELIGDYNFTNLACAYLLAKNIIPDQTDNLIEAAKTFKPAQMRSQWIEWNGKKVFFDAYNANPSSMRLAINAFSKYVGENSALLIIGDMMELGDNSKLYHEGLGEELTNLPSNIDIVYIGQFAASVNKKYSGMKLKMFKDVENFISSNQLNDFKGNFLFAKASRSLLFERIFDINKN